MTLGIPMNHVRRAFTLLEAMIVVVIIGILAAIVIPNFGSVSDDAKAASVQGTLAGVRSSVASFRSAALLRGASPYPTLTELTTVGTVVQMTIPPNPFTSVSGVQTVTATQARARSVVNSATYGWNYCVDTTVTPHVMFFYANCTNTTTVSNGSGGFLAANRL